MSWLFSTLLRSSHPEFVDGQFRFLTLVTVKCRPFLFLLTPIGSSLELHWVSAASSINWEICFTWIFANSFIFPSSETFESSLVALSKKGTAVLFLPPTLYTYSQSLSSTSSVPQRESIGDSSFIFLTSFLFFGAYPLQWSSLLEATSFELKETGLLNKLVIAKRKWERTAIFRQSLKGSQALCVDFKALCCQKNIILHLEMPVLLVAFCIKYEQYFKILFFIFAKLA